MKFKRIILITLLLFAIFTIGTVSAADNNATDEVVNTESDNDAFATINLDEKSSENATSTNEVLGLNEMSNETALTSNDNEDNILSWEDDDELQDTDSRKLSAKSIKVYSDKKFTYSVKLTDNNKPVSGETIELTIFDSKDDCTYYSARTNSKGIATFKLGPHSKGKYLVYIETYDLFEEKYITVLQNTKITVKAPKVTAYYKANKYFKVAVKRGVKAVKNLKLKVKVFTGKKSKTYTIKTNKKGVAKLSTKKFKVGSHKVIITSKNSKVKFSKTSKIVIKKKKASKYKIITTKAKKYWITRCSGKFTVKTIIYDMTAGIMAPYKYIDVFLLKNNKMVHNTKYSVNYKINGKWTGWIKSGIIETSHHRYPTSDGSSVGKIKVKVKK